MKKSPTTYHQESVDEIDLIIAKNDAINAVEVFENNKKTINDIYLNTIASGIFQYDNHQLDQLRKIALQCPLSGGNAVFMARGMLKRVENIHFDDKELCSNKQYAQTKSSDSASIPLNETVSITIFPNPTTGMLNLRLNKAYDADIHLTIYSLTGQSVEDLILGRGRKSYHLDVSSLESGIYFYQSIVDGEKITGKITIVK